MPVEYRFVIRPNQECCFVYRKGKIVHRNGKKYFYTYPLAFDESKNISKLPLSICKREEELTDKECLDILVDWNGPLIDQETGEPTGIEIEYRTISELTKALRLFQYDEEE